VGRTATSLSSSFCNTRHNLSIVLTTNWTSNAKRLNTLGAHETLDGKRNLSKLIKPKTRQVSQFTEADLVNPTVEGEGDAFYFGNQDITLYHKSQEGDTLE
jgi:hypothetical protein